MEGNGEKAAVQRGVEFSLSDWGDKFGRRLLSETHHPAGQLATLMAAIRLEKRSGLLEIYFSQGSPNGTLKFTETRKE
jgi:hypothetical protein